MSSSSPASVGFGTIFRRPSILLAEIAWRWSYAAAAWFLVSIFFAAYMGSLPVSALDRALLRSGQPALIARALHHIFSGSGFRFTTTGILLTIGLIIGWLVLGSLSRFAIVRAAASELGVGVDAGNRTVWGVIFLNFIRGAVALAAFSIVAGSVILTSSLWASPHPPSSGAALLVGLCWFLAWISWAFLNWLLSFASVLAPLEHSAAAALPSALKLITRKTGAVFFIGILFGCCHLAAFVAAWFAASTVLGLSGILPLRGLVVLLAVVAMSYCALVDFFYTGRLVAYVSLLRAEEASAVNAVFTPPFPQGGFSIDKDELILSDAPAPAI